MLHIGQAPRTELVDDLLRWLPPGTEVVEAGVLDGLDLEQIHGLAPRADDATGTVDVLTTKLPDGTTVVLDERHVVERLPDAVARLEQVVDLTFLSCTGQFPALAHRKPLVTPEDLMTAELVDSTAVTT